MNYRKIYYAFVDKRRRHPAKGAVVEHHHILPRCEGGKDIKINIVTLTVREHIFAHELLTRIYKSEKLRYARDMMLSPHGVKLNSHHAARIREQFVREYQTKKSAAAAKWRQPPIDSVTFPGEKETQPSVLQKRIAEEFAKLITEHDEKALDEFHKSLVETEEQDLGNLCRLLTFKQSLPPTDKVILEMSDNGMSPDEIGRKMKIATGIVRYQLQQTKETIEKYSHK